VRPGRWLGWALAIVLAGCASEKPKPTALQTVEPKIAGRLVWSARLDSVQFPLVVAVRDGAFVVAGSDGTVASLDAGTGRELWRGSAGTGLTAGVGSDGSYAAVVTRDNELVVLERGVERWRKRLNSRATTAPLVAGERVFVMGVDRIVLAFDLLDGRALWRLQRPSDALTLALPGVVSAYKDTLLVGQGAFLTGVDPTRGTVRWEVALASPRGTNEVERLADLTGPALRIDNTVCARAFQSAVGCANADAGVLRWSRNVGGIQAIGGDAEYLFGADASDRITAWRAASGDMAWTNESMLHRGLSGPLSAGPAVVFGDSEGYVHFLSRQDGHSLLRLPTDGSPVVGVPALSGTTILVATRKGGLFAFRPD
jgi:outer membrane protein assembly factor BamB